MQPISGCFERNLRKFTLLAEDGAGNRPFYSFPLTLQHAIVSASGAAVRLSPRPNSTGFQTTKMTITYSHPVFDHIEFLPGNQRMEVKQAVIAQLPYVSLPSLIVRHCNGDPRQVYRKPVMFYLHNNEAEQEELKALCLLTRVLNRVTGKTWELAHLTSVANADSHPEGKVNNVKNLAPVLQKANQMVGPRNFTRANYEVLNILVDQKYHQQARAFARSASY